MIWLFLLIWFVFHFGCGTLANVYFTKHHTDKFTNRNVWEMVSLFFAGLAGFIAELVVYVSDTSTVIEPDYKFTNWLNRKNNSND